MGLTQDKALQAANAAAQAAYVMCAPLPLKKWWQALGAQTVDEVAVLVFEVRSADELYRMINSERADYAVWGSDEPLQVALMTFYAVLPTLTLLAADSGARAKRQRCLVQTTGVVELRPRETRG
jgi:hypothetical protein